MAAPVIVALTNEYVTAVTADLFGVAATPEDAAVVRAALEAAAVSTDQAEQPDLFGSTP